MARIGNYSPYSSDFSIQLTFSIFRLFDNPKILQELLGGAENILEDFCFYTIIFYMICAIRTYEGEPLNERVSIGMCEPWGAFFTQPRLRPYSTQTHQHPASDFLLGQRYFNSSLLSNLTLQSLPPPSSTGSEEGEVTSSPLATEGDYDSVAADDAAAAAAGDS